MTTATKKLIDQIYLGVASLLETVSCYPEESPIRSSFHTLPASDCDDDNVNVLIDLAELEKGLLAELVEGYPSIESVKISGLGALIGRQPGTFNVMVTYKRSTL